MAFTNKARKLEVAESNLIMESIPYSHSLSIPCSHSLTVSVGVSFLFVLVNGFSLAHSFLNSFVDATLQLLLCGVTSSSVTLIND